MIAQDRFRGLFHKYLLALFMAVAIPLAFNGVMEAWFGYRDQRARLDQLLGVQVASAAAEIHDFIYGITTQLGWLVQLPWTDEPDERRRTDVLRLFRQAPAIVSLTLLDNNGLERLYISRIGLNRIESRTDRSTDPALVGARAAQIWFSDVSYNRGSEPYLTVAVACCSQSVPCWQGFSDRHHQDDRL
jgi:adenylate cyclase